MDSRIEKIIDIIVNYDTSTDAVARREIVNILRSMGYKVPVKRHRKLLVDVLNEKYFEPLGLSKVANFRQASKRLRRLYYIRDTVLPAIRPYIEEGRSYIEIMELTGFSYRSIGEAARSDSRLATMVQRNWKAKAKKLALNNVEKINKKYGKGERSPKWYKPTKEDAEKILNAYKKLREDGYVSMALISKESGLTPKIIKRTIDMFNLNIKPDGPRRGRFNAAYGKTPSRLSGKSYKGYICLGDKWYVFGSLLEAYIFLKLYEDGEAFRRATFRIKYEFDGVERTYQPDIIIGGRVYEIKPQKLTGTSINQAKIEALRQWCKSHPLYEFGGFITDKDYNPWSYEGTTRLLEAYWYGILVFGPQWDSIYREKSVGYLRRFSNATISHN